MFISLIVYFNTFSMYELYFSHLSFLENGMDEKFWKKIQMLVRPIDWVVCPLICSTSGDLVPCLNTFSDVRNRVFLTSSHVSGERYERKILKKNPVVPLSTSYHLNYFIRWDLLLGTLRITYCTTPNVLKSGSFHFKPRCRCRIWSKNSVKNSGFSSW